MTTHPPRTNQQNKALHKYFSLLAEKFDSGGYDVMKTLRHDIAIPWNGDLIKELIWRRVQNAIIGEKSTTKLDTAEVSQIYEVINRYTAEKFGISVPFPSIKEFMK